MALIEVLGCAEADHNQEGRKADRTIEWAAMPGKQGKFFFFFLSQIFLSIMCFSQEFLFCGSVGRLWVFGEGFFLSI